MLEKIKLLLGIQDDSKNDLLTILIEEATDEALTYTHQENIDELIAPIIQMVIFKYNRIGTEGVDSEGYSGVSFSYSADYPENIMRGLKAKRKLITL